MAVGDVHWPPVFHSSEPQKRAMPALQSHWVRRMILLRLLQSA
jgi:hypothetical protein